MIMIGSFHYSWCVYEYLKCSLSHFWIDARLGRSFILHMLKRSSLEGLKQLYNILKLI